MKRFVEPLTWSRLNRVEHPPLMLKQLVQGVCGGLRWLEAKDLAAYIAQRAVEEGAPCSKKDRKALGVAPRKTRGKAHCAPQPDRSGERALVSFSGVGPVGGTELVIPPKRPRRLVTYDVLDCTFGGGYHTGAILENGRPYTRVAALDCDEESALSARDIVNEFGGSRFRYYNSKMSEIQSLFGERSFDAIMVDPGPSVTQLEDPTRGFLLDEESEHALDMRYCIGSGVPALSYLNTVPQHALARALESYELLTPQQSMKLARAIRLARPFGSSRKLLDVVEAAGDELPEDGWATQTSRRKTPMSWSFLVSLRCVVNKERWELNEALHQSIPMLKKDGRLVIFTRLAWEERLVQDFIQGHPHALLSYTENVELEDIQEHGHTRHTKMWVATKVKESAHVLKNTVSLTDDDVKESSARWMSGLYAGQTYGFPAHNFTFESMDAKERRIQRNNARPPPVDHDNKGDRFHQ